MASDPILVVGGGLGGASVALALARKGFAVRVLEEAPEFGVIGYGIQLAPNVFPMFDRLGVTDAVLATALRPKAILMVDSVDGDVIARIPTGDSFVRRFKRPYVVIHRVDLHRALLDACQALPDVELIPSTGVVSYEDLGPRVRVTAQDGRHFEGAALIAAVQQSVEASVAAMQNGMQEMQAGTAAAEKSRRRRRPSWRQGVMPRMRWSAPARRQRRSGCNSFAPRGATTGL